MKPAIFSSIAREEFLDAIRRIAENNPVAAKALKDDARQVARTLGNHPLLGCTRPDLASPPVRFYFMTGFPYVIVYDPELEPPVVLRFLHEARHLPEILRDL